MVRNMKLLTTLTADHSGTVSFEVDFFRTHFDVLIWLRMKYIPTLKTKIEKKKPNYFNSHVDI